MTLQRGDHLFKAGVDLLYNRVKIAVSRRAAGQLHLHVAGQLPARRSTQQYQQAFGDAVAAASRTRTSALFVQDEWRAAAGADGDARPALRPAVAAAADRARRATTSRRGSASRGRRGDGTRCIARAAGSISTAFRCARRPTRCSATASTTRSRCSSFGQAGAPALPAVLPAFPAGVLTAITSIDPDMQNGRSRAGRAAGRARARASMLSATAGYSYLRGQRHHHVAQHQRADADGGAGGRAGRRQPRTPEPGVRQHQPVPGDRRLLVRRPDAGAGDARRGVGPRARRRTRCRRRWTRRATRSSRRRRTTHDIAAEKGPSDNDQRHRLVVSGTFGGTGGSAAVRRALRRRAVRLRAGRTRRARRSTSSPAAT